MSPSFSRYRKHLGESRSVGAVTRKISRITTERRRRFRGSLGAGNLPPSGITVNARFRDFLIGQPGRHGARGEREREAGRSVPTRASGSSE